MFNIIQVNKTPRNFWLVIDFHSVCYLNWKPNAENCFPITRVLLLLLFFWIVCSPPENKTCIGFSTKNHPVFRSLPLFGFGQSTTTMANWIDVFLVRCTYCSHNQLDILYHWVSSISDTLIVTIAITITYPMISFVISHTHTHIYCAHGVRLDKYRIAWIWQCQPNENWNVVTAFSFSIQ